MFKKPLVSILDTDEKEKAVTKHYSGRNGLFLKKSCPSASNTTKVKGSLERDGINQLFLLGFKFSIGVTSCTI